MLLALHFLEQSQQMVYLTQEVISCSVAMLPIVLAPQLSQSGTLDSGPKQYMFHMLFPCLNVNMIEGQYHVTHGTPNLSGVILIDVESEKCEGPGMTSGSEVRNHGLKSRPHPLVSAGPQLPSFGGFLVKKNERKG